MISSETTQPYIDRFGRIKDALPGNGLPWLAAMRAAGLERFAAAGFPTPRREAWKYTNLRSLEREPFVNAPAPAAGAVDHIPSLLAPDVPCNRAVFVDGRFRADLSTLSGLPSGVSLTGLGDTLRTAPDRLSDLLGRVADMEDNPLVALNTAFMEDGFVLTIDRNVTVRDPIEIVHIGTIGDGPFAIHPRNLIVAGENSEATIVEHHIGLGGGTYFVNAVTEVTAAQGARLHHHRLQNESENALFLCLVAETLEKDVTLDNFVLNVGGRLARTEVRALLNGSDIDYRVNGAYMVRGRQHCDITTEIDHAKPRCRSHELIKGVIDDEARAVFQGRILVREHAQKTDGYQLNRALLLSDTAEIDSKPELEIYADDVKCSHGATAGELEDASLFYLRARGIPEPDARRMLIAAFLDDAVNQIPVDAVRDAFHGAVAKWLNRD